ncbi:MAG: hypothetical protein HYW50_03265, partial [Candidatus Diapherotrites archaeon]|nr:hypothetical protein [Candidatus Diapherotrites archaeon]
MLRGFVGLKEFYRSLEDKYYAFLDKLNESAPVYSVVDPIDNVFPSFALVLGIVFILLLGGIFAVFSFTAIPQESTVTFIVKNDEGRALENAKIFVTGIALQGELEKTTDKSGRTEIIVPFGSEISVRVQKRTYTQTVKQLIANEKQLIAEIFLAKEILPPTPYTISFAAPTGEKLLGQEIVAVFGCTNSSIIIQQPEQVTTEGEITFTPPQGCGLLTVRAQSTGYLSLEQAIDLPAKVLSFQALPIPKGEIIFFIKESGSNQSLNGIKVSVFDLQNFEQSGPKYSERGEVSFSLEPGEYRAVIEDEAGSYPTAEETFSISIESTVTKNVSLSKNPAATLKISVKDKDSKVRVNDAIVVLKKQNGDIAGERKISTQAPQAVFVLSEKGIYKFSASHADYLPAVDAQIDLSSAAPNSVHEREMELQKCTPQRCGILVVKVVDEENRPVENAKVFLYDMQTNSIATELGEKVTDANGQTQPFTNLPAKEFFAQAQKYPASGKSQKIQIDTTAKNELTVKMEIGKGKIEIDAVDLQQSPIPFATAEIKDASGKTIATVSIDEKGHAVFETRADKQVFVVVSKEGFVKYSSILYQVVKNSSIKIRAELPAALENNEIEAKFLGAFDQKGSLITDTLSAGNSYNVRFQLLVPKNYKKAGLHFRVGKEQFIAQDKLFIKTFNAPATTAIAGKSFSPPTGEQADFQNISSGDAKWVNLVWENVSAGIYSVEIQVVIRAQTTVGSELQLHYRSWAVNEQDRFLRHPLDAVLGEQKETAAKQEIYAEVFTNRFFEGSQKVCNESFCYSERVFDPKEGLIFPKAPYPMRVFDNYKLNFEITNNSGKVFDNADLRIKNTADGATTDDTISIENYVIKNAAEVEFASQQASFGLADPLDTGYFAPFRSIRGEMTLQA